LEQVRFSLWDYRWVKCHIRKDAYMSLRTPSSNPLNYTEIVSNVEEDKIATCLER
jgi:hypothetical protein